MNKILGSNGRVVKAAFDFYQLPGGVVLYSQEVKEEDGEYIFESTKTCIVTIQMTREGPRYGATRVTDAPLLFEAGEYRIQKTAVGRFWSVNPGLEPACRSAISGIQL